MQKLWVVKWLLQLYERNNFAMGYGIGDRVVDKENEIVGIVKRFYFPTACAQQTMIVCDDGREYHAPSYCFVELRDADLSKLLKKPQMAMSASTPLMQSAAQPLTVKHNYRNVKIGKNTTITIDVEELKKQMQAEHYKSMGIGLNYGA